MKLTHAQVIAEVLRKMAIKVDGLRDIDEENLLNMSYEDIVFDLEFIKNRLNSLSAKEFVENDSTECEMIIR